VIEGGARALPKTDVSIGLQGFCILFLDPDRFDLAVGGR
jgi:hypothetical protein